ncbi:MAG: alpha/beta hydrolase [Arcicella sp.]|jgi:pimeloyl-ACP methyl ester carboxylesterase|nr:alpha/beta hydrolase [Arcicella sp.]
MKKYHILCLLALLTVVACENDIPEKAIGTMPITKVSINQKITEVSKSFGTTASIVFVGGFGSELATWNKLYTELNPSATIFAYNRAGIGASENIAGLRDAKTIATEMKVILEANNIKPPYVLVAHSMGGIYARMFHHLNPSKVKGIVLVDATHENQLETLLETLPKPDRAFAYQAMEAVNDSLLKTYPAGSVREEFRANFATNYTQIRQFPAIKSIPLYVITSTKVNDENPPFVNDIKKSLHQQWALDAGSNGRFVQTNKSGHFIQIEEPKVVADGVRWILAK